MISANRQSTLRIEADSLFELARPQRVRSMAEFAEQEIVIPDGPFEGRRFRLSRQPYSRLWFEAAAQYVECVITGPSQSGKTLVGFVIPVLDHLFEKRQNVIAAVPDFDMVGDKWQQDILPALERTRFREDIPKGRIGGKQALIKFGNGASLRWMTAGGSDKSRAAFTADVVCMTETDGFDSRVSTSDEADKIEQIEARMRALPLRKRKIYKECTVSTAEGHTWRRYQAGTASRIFLPCPHCRAYVHLERKDFHGWEEAKSDVEAVNQAAFFCNACGEEWKEPERVEANARGVLLHRGQTVNRAGKVKGTPPDTFTLGFRWSAVNNLLVPAGDVGLDEFKAIRAVDEDNEERKMCQFVWCTPYSHKDTEETRLTIEDVQDRSGADGRGVCPEGTRWVTIGVDVNKPVLHWTAIAWYITGDRFDGRIIDYGKQGVRAKELGFDEAIKVALCKLVRETLGKGWSNTPERTFTRVAVDCRWNTKEVIEGIRSLKDRRVRPYMGLGQGHWKRRMYVHPEQHSKKHAWVGNSCYEKIVKVHKMRVLFADANFWKTWLAGRLQSSDEDDTSNGRLTLYETTDENERTTFAKHLTAEREEIRYEQGKGYVREWISVRSANHWLDSTYMACVAGNRSWYRFNPKVKRKQPPKSEPKKERLALGGFNPFRGMR
jgi:phage terminase large subunit GpA-like protein